MVVGDRRMVSSEPFSNSGDRREDSAVCIDIFSEESRVCGLVQTAVMQHWRLHSVKFAGVGQPSILVHKYTETRQGLVTKPGVRTLTSTDGRKYYDHKGYISVTQGPGQGTEA